MTFTLGLYKVHDKNRRILTKIFCALCAFRERKQKDLPVGRSFKYYNISVLHHQQAFMIYFIINKFRPFLNSIMVDKILVHCQCLG